jgi:hypothetical protein
MAMKNIFVITAQHKRRPKYIVTWPGYGSLRKPSSIYILLNWISNTKAFNIVLGNQNNQLTLNDLLYVSSTKELITEYIMERLIIVNYVIFDLLTDAETFIDCAEKDIFWRILTKEHTTTIGDLLGP